MTRCTAEAVLYSQGRAVGTLRCELDAGHDAESTVWDDTCTPQHAATLHWEDGEAIAEDDDAPAVDVPFDDPPCAGSCGCGPACTRGYD